MLGNRLIDTPKIKPDSNGTSPVMTTEGMTGDTKTLLPRWKTELMTSEGVARQKAKAPYRGTGEPWIASGARPSGSLR